MQCIGNAFAVHTIFDDIHTFLRLTLYLGVHVPRISTDTISELTFLGFLIPDDGMLCGVACLVGQVQQFLRYVKDIYKKLPTFLPKIFEQRGQMKVHDLTEVNVDAALEETFTTTTILTEKRNAENQPISVSCCIT